MEGKEDNFRKREEASSTGFSSQYDDAMSLDPKNTPYDMESVLHYGPTDFSKNGKPVIKFLHDDENRWPVAAPEDPLTIIDRVEIALTYGDEARCTVTSRNMAKYVHINRMVNRLWIDNNRKMIDKIKKNSEEKLADIDTNLNAMNAEITNVKIKQTGIDQTQEAREVNLQRVIEEQQGNIDGLHKVNEAMKGEIDGLQRVIEAQQTETKNYVDLLKQLVENPPPAVCRNPNILDSKTRHVSTRYRSSQAAPCGSKNLCCDNESASPGMHPDWRGEGWYRFTGSNFSG